MFPMPTENDRVNAETIASLLAKLRAADKLLEVVNEYYDESDCKDAALDDQMSRAIMEYEALK